MVMFKKCHKRHKTFVADVAGILYKGGGDFYVSY